MPTTDIAIGQLSKLAFAAEAGSYGTPAASSYRYAHFYSLDLRETAPIEGDPIIGSGFHNARDATPPAPALSEHNGSVVVPLCLNQMGDWLKLLFGAPATGGATNFTHVFSSGLSVLPTYTIEANPIAADFRQHVGVAARRLSLSAQDANGFQRATIDLMGYGENLLGATGAGTPTAARAYDPIKATGGQVLLGGTQVGVLLSASLAYDNGMAQERYVDGGGKFGAVVPLEQASLTGELRVRYTGPTLDQAAVAETDQTLEFRFSRGANNSISFLAAAARLARAGVPIEGPGGIEQTLAFRCAQTTGAAMLAVTLKNQIASY